MLHFLFGLVWLTLAVGLLWTREAAEARVQNVGTLIAFSGLFAVYNFLRCGISWFSRRRRERDEQDSK